LNTDRSKPIGTNIEFYVNQLWVDNDGNTNPARLVVSPIGNSTTYDISTINKFSNVIDLSSDFVYFIKDGDDYEYVEPTKAIIAKFTDAEQDEYTPADGEADQNTYIRRRGRSGIDFMWSHFSPDDNIVDSSTTNINDIYVLTQGYYNSVISYVRNITDEEPVEPTSIDLKASYKDYLSSKMLSDTVILHSAKIKLLFGDKANKQLRCKFKIIKAQSATMSDELLIKNVISYINDYFNIDDWSFGETFYAQHMLTYVQTRLPTEILSVVIVPTYADNYFGDMLIIECGVNEIFQTCATVDDVEIVTTYNDSNIRMK
jgi:hypothetical protein